MKKDSRKINLLSLSILLFLIGGILLSSPAMAQAKDFEVDFEYDPLFKEANFLPGDSVTRYIRVTNNSDQIQRIATKAINYSGFPNPDDVPAGDLSRALSIIIREKGSSDLYGGTTGEKTLFDFYKKGETYLSDLPIGDTEEYEYEITFPSVKENEWQGTTTAFDIQIGYQSATQSLGGGTYTFVGGSYSTTTTIPTTTTTIPGEVQGEATKREFFEEGEEEELPGTTTTTTSPLKLVAGASIIKPFSCPVNLTMSGINPLLASLLCLGQGMCDSCLNPWLVLLLGLTITLGSAILVKKDYE